MKNNVLSWRQAFDEGLNPSIYPYKSDQVPIGEITVVLDFKIWAKKVIGIDCYFSVPEGTNRFRITIFYSSSNGYRTDKEGVDFSCCETGKLYRINTAVRKTGNVFIKSASEL